MVDILRGNAIKDTPADHFLPTDPPSVVETSIIATPVNKKSYPLSSHLSKMHNALKINERTGPLRLEDPPEQLNQQQPHYQQQNPQNEKETAILLKMSKKYTKLNNKHRKFELTKTNKRPEE